MGYYDVKKSYQFRVAIHFANRVVLTRESAHTRNVAWKSGISVFQITSYEATVSRMEQAILTL